MQLQLMIENETTLPDGGPVSYTMPATRGGINIGRDHYLDWVLPDPTRFISGTHCEIRYRDGGFWLHDISTNGTYINGSEFRPPGPHLLKNGDRLEIGRYVIVVTVEGEPEAAAAAKSYGYNPAAVSQDSPASWDLPAHAAPEAIDSRALDSRYRSRSLGTPDFLDWMADMPSLRAPAQSNPVPQPPLKSYGVNDGQAQGRNLRGAAAFPAGDEWLKSGGEWAQPAQSQQARTSDSADVWQDVQSPPAPVTTPWTREPQSRAPQSQEDSDPWAKTPAPLLDHPVDSQADASHEPPATLTPGDFSDVQGNVDYFRSEEPVRETPGYPASDLGEPSPPARARPANGPFDGQEFLSRFARGANIPREVIRQMDPGDFAELLGELLLVTAENLRQLQLARAQFKGMIRSAQHTLVGPVDNNPLRFAPTADAALRIMFGPPQEGYLDARRALENAFDGLKRHQLGTVTAMQQALRQLIGGFDPKAIDAAAGADKGVGSLLGSRKAKLWEKYEASWQSRFGDHEDAPLNTFLRLFADAYDKTN